MQEELAVRRIEVLENFAMPQLGRTRRIRVFLPKGYANGLKRFPVIYMHDGQNLFCDHEAAFGASWQLPATLDRMQASGETDGYIVVAIDNGSEFNGLCRFYEYSPWQMDPFFDLPGRPDATALKRSGGQGLAYVSFVADTLKPYIDSHYRTLTDRRQTAIAGSSMGGLISLFAALERQDSFGLAGVFSPAFWFNEPACYEYLRSVCPSQVSALYMDIGSAETSDDQRPDFPQVYLKGVRRMSNLLAQKPGHIALHYLEEAGAIHYESAWAGRFPEMVRFFESARKCIL